MEENTIEKETWVGVYIKRRYLYNDISSKKESIVMENKINSILNDMSEVLNIQQLKKLQVVLLDRGVSKDK